MVETPALVQRLRNDPVRFFVCEWLGFAGDDPNWLPSEEGAFRFPDSLRPRTCTLADSCRQHAECASKAHGGFPVIIGGSVKEQAMKAAPALHHRQQPDPSEVFRRYEKEGLA